MSQTSPNNELRNSCVVDALGEDARAAEMDRIFSGYFKSRMQQPWPAAPATPSRVNVMEPSSLVAARNSEQPRNQPADVSGSPSRGSGGKSRYTLAVSVVALLGACWCLSNTFLPGAPSGVGVPAPKVFGVLPDSHAEKPAALEEHRKDKAINGNEGVAVPQIRLP